MTSWTSLSPRCGSSSVAARVDTTACVRSPSRWAPGTICACGSVSADHQGGWTQPTMYCTTSPVLSEARCPLLISDAADAVERLVAEGLVAAQQVWHSR